jgi:hypothetical protein
MLAGVKRRWSILFWCALASLIGMSWLANSLGISLGSFMGVSLIGMVLATVMAFGAMVRNISDKWPAAIVLVCAGPMILDAFRMIGQLSAIVRFFGPSFAVVMAGALATGGTSILILALPLPAPPPQPRVAPARVVD